MNPHFSVVATTTIYTIPVENIKRGSWFNVAFSLLISSKARNMDVYVSGNKVVCEEKAFVSYTYYIYD
jgi:hypothetical protein